jgi:hypothetical protein
MFFAKATIKSSITGNTWVLGSQEVALHLTIEGQGSRSVEECVVKAKQLSHPEWEEMEMVCSVPVTLQGNSP